jgi:hypothetical protein
MEEAAVILTLLIVSLSAVALAYGAYLLWSAAGAGQRRPSGEAILLGAVTNFFDTLGIGSFAPSIAWMRFRRLVPDRLIPLTMLGGYILPAIAQALIFLVLLGVKIDPLLLLQCIIAMVIGGIVGVPSLHGRRFGWCKGLLAWLCWPLASSTASPTWD